MPENQFNKRLQSSSEDKMATQRGRKTLASEAFFAVFRPHVPQLSSCGNFSENNLQNHGRYLFWRVFSDFVSKNIVLKGVSKHETRNGGYCIA